MEGGCGCNSKVNKNCQHKLNVAEAENRFDHKEMLIVAEKGCEKDKRLMRHEHTNSLSCDQKPASTAQLYSTLAL